MRAGRYSMSKAVAHKKPMFVHFRREEQKTHPINLKITPSQAKRWKEITDEFGVDLSTFIRGAVESAIFNSLRAKDPQWQKFMEAIQPTAQKTLGYGLYDGGIEDFEAGGTERKGTPADEFLETLKLKAAKKHA